MVVERGREPARATAETMAAIAGVAPFIRHSRTATALPTTVTFKSTADGLSMSAPTGESYDAKFDGKDYPIKGDPGASMVSLKRVDERTIEETIKRDNKVVTVNRLTLSPDGRTLNFVTDNKEQGTTMTFAAKKQ